MKTSHILLTVGLVAVVGLGLNPVRKNVIEKEEKNEQLFAQTETLLERVKAVETTQTEGSITAIPSTPEQIALVNDVNRIAKKTGFSLPQDWSFSLGTNSDVNAEQVSLSFTLSGRRQQILNFLKEIEQNPRFMGVRSFAFTTDVEPSIPQTKMDISLYAFFIEA